MNLIQNFKAKASIEANLARRRHGKCYGDLVTLKRGRYAGSDHGPCEVTAVIGSGCPMIKRAARWTGWYGTTGVLSHEEYQA